MSWFILYTINNPEPEDEDASEPAFQGRIYYAWIQIIIYALILPVVLRIAWKHGRNGTDCWLMLIAFLLARLIGDGFTIADGRNPERKHLVSLVTTAASINFLTLTILGMAAEAYVTFARI